MRGTGQVEAGAAEWPEGGIEDVGPTPAQLDATSDANVVDAPIVADPMDARGVDRLALPDRGTDRTMPDDAGVTAEVAQVAGDADRDASTLPCDPVTGAGCPDGQKCAVNNTSTGGFVRCLSYGAGLLGQTCTYTAAGDSCIAGLSCFQISGESKPTCRRLCPWELQGTQPEICAYAVHGRCSIMMTALKIAYCN